MCAWTYMSCSFLLAEPRIRVWEVNEWVDDFLVDAVAFDLSFQTRAVAMLLMVDCGSHLGV